MGYHTTVLGKRTAETHPHNSLFRSAGHVPRYCPSNLLFRMALGLSISNSNIYNMSQNGMLIKMKDTKNIKKQYNVMIRPAQAMILGSRAPCHLCQQHYLSRCSVWYQKAF